MTIILQTMSDYSQTKIYKLVCNITSDVYIGHTTMTLEKRLTIHKAPSNPCCSKQIIERGDYRIELLEHYPCINKKEAHVRERWFIEHNECINKYVPGRTKKEYLEANREQILSQQKEYNDANKERHKDYRKANKERILAYYQDNIEHLREQSKEYYENNKEHSALTHKIRYQWIVSWDGGSKHKGLNQIDLSLFE